MTFAQTEFSKFETTKKLTFNKPYGNRYKKGDIIYIHESTVKAKDLEKYAKVENVDFKSLYNKAKQNKNK